MRLTPEELEWHEENGINLNAYMNPNGEHRARFMPPAEYRQDYKSFNRLKAHFNNWIHTINPEYYLRFKATSRTISNLIEDPSYRHISMMKLELAYKGYIFSSREIGNNEIALWTYMDLKQWALGEILKAIDKGAIQRTDMIRAREEEARKAYEMAY